jgi:hypothetical protein
MEQQNTIYCVSNTNVVVIPRVWADDSLFRRDSRGMLPGSTHRHGATGQPGEAQVVSRR